MTVAPEQPVAPERTDNFVDRNNHINFARTKEKFDGKGPEEITDGIRNRFFNGDRVYIALNDKIGDMVQSVGFFNSLIEAQRVTGTKTPITLMVPTYSLRRLFGPYAQMHGMEVVPAGAAMQGLSLSHMLSEGRERTNSLHLELQHIEGDTLAIEDGLGRVTVRDMFNQLNAKYDNKNAGTARYAWFTEDFLGLKRGTLNPEACLPSLPLSEKANDVYNGLVRKYGVNLAKKQIAIVLNASGPGRMYDGWGKVISQLLADQRGTAEVNIIYDKSKAPDDPTRVDPNQLNDMIAKNGWAAQGVRLVDGSLDEMTVMLANQSVVLAADSGLSHISGAIEGGPRVVPLYMPPNMLSAIWETNPKRMSGISAPLEGRDSNPIRGGDACTDPKLKWINLIPPEAIAKKGIRLMRTAVERPSLAARKEDALNVLYRELLGRAPDLDGLRTYLNPNLSIPQVAESIRNSPERRRFEVTQEVQRFLGRQPNAVEINEYSKLLAEGRPIGEVKVRIAGSDEFRRRLSSIFPARVAAGFIYGVLLERGIDPDGMQAYVIKNAPVMGILSAVLNSPEFKSGFL